MSDDDLILLFYDLMERVEKSRSVNAAGAHDALSDLLEIAAEERGAFLEAGNAD